MKQNNSTNELASNKCSYGKANCFIILITVITLILSFILYAVTGSVCENFCAILCVVSMLIIFFIVIFKNYVYFFCPFPISMELCIKSGKEGKPVYDYPLCGLFSTLIFTYSPEFIILYYFHISYILIIPVSCIIPMMILIFKSEDFLPKFCVVWSRVSTLVQIVAVVFIFKYLL